MGSLQILKFSSKGAEIPFKPFAHIAIKESGVMSYKTRRGKGDFRVLSPRCSTYRELEYNANELIAQLENIKKQALRFFEKHR